MYFYYFAIIYPWKKAYSTEFEQIKNLFTKWYFVSNMVEIDLMDLVKKIFFNLINVFKLFRYYLPFNKGVTLHLNKFEIC